MEANIEAYLAQKGVDYEKYNTCENIFGDHNFHDVIYYVLEKFVEFDSR